MAAAPFLAHILLQTRASVRFLVTQKQVSEEDGKDIISKLPKPDYLDESQADEAALVEKAQKLAVSGSSFSEAKPAAPAYAPPPGPPYQPPPSAPSNNALFRARAAWDYNVSGENPGDLSFRAGDVIEIIAETNADWWTGRLNGREGLLPSTYVERLPPAQGTLPWPARTSDSEKPAAASSYPIGPYPSYQPPGGYQGPPPPGQAYTPYGGPPPAAPGPNAPANTEDPPKKGKFGGLGNTVAHAAAGGVGFGAGNAIGSGLIHSIF
ncbi:putative SH3-domain-containing protein [Lyophyllum shimeji]|uniref:SH3-domain-containing protein n=1 Tax=Lyophyllum shimeji TaxID=47721 RepID=A0A9P3PJ21_LYOSH|nr:putative SH3-domain-containing protein [Lyophyllum shimeji]